LDLTNLNLANKRVLVTGHTGFKGSWLSMVLDVIGARLYGLSLSNNEPNSMYRTARISDLFMEEYFVDLRDYQSINDKINRINPEYVFHLAAQSLVLKSIQNPIETFSTNILGTVNLLDILLKNSNLKGVLVVTSDKVYKPKQVQSYFRETDELGGGHDPYSVSKASAELVTQSMSITSNVYSIPIATARAGNVVGGCDWAEDRLLPDLFRSISIKAPLQIRQPRATRPWQHVLDCIYGYLLIAEQHLSRKHAKQFDSFNFGPEESLTVMEVINIFNQTIGLKANVQLMNFADHEQIHLAIDSSKARSELNWVPFFSPENAIRSSIKFYTEFIAGQSAHKLARSDITNYFNSQIS
jgi:CDP-glucose 4,6-dehydratase